MSPGGAVAVPPKGSVTRGPRGRAGAGVQKTTGRGSSRCPASVRLESHAVVPCTGASGFRAGDSCRRQREGRPPTAVQTGADSALEKVAT